jgi:hypothetical protein
MKMLARVMAMVATVAGFSAIASGVSFGFRNKALRGEYIFQAAGVLGRLFGSSEEAITVLGLLTFAVDGNAQGTVTFSRGDHTLEVGQNCTFSLHTAFAVTVSNGVSSMILSFCPSGTCTTDGTLTFNFVTQRGAQEARLMLTAFSPALPLASSSPDPNGICGAELAFQSGGTTFFSKFTLAGDLAKQ